MAATTATTAGFLLLMSLPSLAIGASASESATAQPKAWIAYQNGKVQRSSSEIREHCESRHLDESVLEQLSVASADRSELVTLKDELLESYFETCLRDYAWADILQRAGEPLGINVEEKVLDRTVEAALEDRLRAFGKPRAESQELLADHLRATIFRFEKGAGASQLLLLWKSFKRRQLLEDIRVKYVQRVTSALIEHRYGPLRLSAVRTRELYDQSIKRYHEARRELEGSGADLKRVREARAKDPEAFLLVQPAEASLEGFSVRIAPLARYRDKDPSLFETRKAQVQAALGAVISAQSRDTVLSDLGQAVSYAKAQPLERLEELKNQHFFKCAEQAVQSSCLLNRLYDLATVLKARDEASRGALLEGTRSWLDQVFARLANEARVEALSSGPHGERPFEVSFAMLVRETLSNASILPAAVREEDCSYWSKAASLVSWELAEAMQRKSLAMANEIVRRFVSERSEQQGKLLRMTAPFGESVAELARLHPLEVEPIAEIRLESTDSKRPELVDLAFGRAPYYSSLASGTLGVRYHAPEGGRATVELFHVAAIRPERTMPFLEAGAWDLIAGFHLGATRTQRLARLKSELLSEVLDEPSMLMVDPTGGSARYGRAAASFLLGTKEGATR